MLKDLIPVVLAHRGLSADYPENTMLAFEAALQGEHPAHGIELDIVFSKDDCPMVIHDETLTRTTNGEGAVANLSATELKQLDAGSWFGDKLTTAAIPTLDEVLLKLGKSCFINIEIKPRLMEGNLIPAKHLNKIISLLTEYALFDSSVVSSFDHRSLLEMRSLSDMVNLAPIYDDLPTIEDATQMMQQLSALSIHLNADKVSEEWVSAWQESQEVEPVQPVLCWTVDDPQRMTELFSWGVSGVFSNRSNLLLKHLNK